jgi:hypothetical protein
MLINKSDVFYVCLLSCNFLRHIYKSSLTQMIMAATAPGARKKKLEYNVDGAVFDDFMKACSRKGFAPQVILEQAMKKFTQTGQI